MSRPEVVTDLDILTPTLFDAPGLWKPHDAGEATAALAQFPNQGMRHAAQAIVASHPRASQYLVQAPVLALAACWGSKSVDHDKRRHVASAFAGRLRSDPRLPDLMRSFQIAPQFRRLSPKIMAPNQWWPVCLVSQLVDPSTLSQIFPEQPGQQLRWLRAVARWCHRVLRHGVILNEPSARVAWAARALAAVEQSRLGHAEDLADFSVRSSIDGAPFDERWSLDQAIAAAERWHVRLGKNIDAAEFERRHGVGPDEVLVGRRTPDRVRVGGYDFVLLRTGRDLFVEGRAMHHCAVDMTSYVAKGASLVYSMRKGGDRVATFALRLSTRDPARPFEHEQLRGHCNAWRLGRPARAAAEGLLDRINVVFTAP